MIVFDSSKLHVRYVMLKSCTSALGGSIRVVDELATAADARGREIYRKMDVPMALVRAFVQQHKMSQYLKPVPVAVTTYDNHVVALERHPLGSAGTLEEDIRHTQLFDEGPTRWISKSERNIQGAFQKLLDEHEGDWYIDGKYIWNFPKPIEECVNEGDFLSSDGKFRNVGVNAIKLADIGDNAKLCVSWRCCLAFVASRTVDNAFAVSPPVWKTLEIADRQLSGVKQDDDRVSPEGEEKKYRFDEIDEWLAVNLNFVLKAGKELGQIFGPEIMEPLSLPKLMIQLQTVNLPSVANSVKSTFDTGIQFTHACAWLIGLVSRTNTFESYMVLRSLLKYLTSKGIFRKHLFRPEHVFKNGHNLESVPGWTKDEIWEKREEQRRAATFKEGFEVVGAETDIEEWVRRQRATGGSTNVLGTDVGNAVTGMVDDEFGVDD